MAIESTTNTNVNTKGNNKKNKKSDADAKDQPEKKSLNKINRININDLVASVINQHTSSQQQQSIDSANTYTANNVTTDSNNNKQSLTVEDFDRLVKTSQTVAQTATIGGIKVTVLGAQDSAASPLLVSPSTTATSTNSSFSQLPNELNANTTKSSSQHKTTAAQHQQKKPINLSVNNANARAMLEKPQKDLHRQQQTLNKLVGSFHDEQTRSQTAIIQQFNKIRQLIDQRQAFLLSQLNTSSTTGNRLLQQRQTKASDLRVLVDNAVHLGDDEVLELKADIKHFVSERQLDEELGSVKLFDETTGGMDRVAAAIASYGAVQLVQDKYAKQRPPLNELLSDNNNESSQANKKAEAKNTNVNVDSNNNNNNNRAKEAKNTESGGFIEVKSRSNRNNKPNNQPSKQSNNSSNNAKLLAQNNFNRLSTVN